MGALITEGGAEQEVLRGVVYCDVNESNGSTVRSHARYSVAGTVAAF